MTVLALRAQAVTTFGDEEPPDRLTALMAFFFARTKRRGDLIAFAERDDFLGALEDLKRAEGN